MDAWQDIEKAEEQFLNTLADLGGLAPETAGMLRHCARLIKQMKARHATPQPAGAVPLPDSWWEDDDKRKWVSLDDATRYGDARAQSMFEMMLAGRADAVPVLREAFDDLVCTVDAVANSGDYVLSDPAAYALQGALEDAKRVPEAKPAGSVPLAELVLQALVASGCVKQHKVDQAREIMRPFAAGRADAVPFDFARARTLIDHVIGYARATELRSLSSDACAALKDLHAMLTAAPLPQQPAAEEAAVPFARGWVHIFPDDSQGGTPGDWEFHDISACPDQPCPACRPAIVVLTDAQYSAPAPQQMTTQGEAVDPWATIIALCEALDIDPETARSAPGKPSDVILEAARKKFTGSQP